MPRPNQKFIASSLPEDLVKSYKVYCALNDMTVADLIKKAIKEYMERNPVEQNIKAA